MDILKATMYRGISQRNKAFAAAALHGSNALVEMNFLPSWSMQTRPQLDGNLRPYKVVWQTRGRHNEGFWLFVRPVPRYQSGAVRDDDGAADKAMYAQKHGLKPAELAVRDPTLA